jgi:hypothetical protein
MIQQPDADRRSHGKAFIHEVLKLLGSSAASTPCSSWRSEASMRGAGAGQSFEGRVVQIDRLFQSTDDLLSFSLPDGHLHQGFAGTKDFRSSHHIIRSVGLLLP